MSVHWEQQISGGNATWGSISGSVSDQQDLHSVLSEKVNIDEIAAVVPAVLDSAMQSTLPSMVQAQVSSIIGSTPAALDTLQELAQALGNDPNFATTVTNTLSTKVNTSDPRLTDARVPVIHTHPQTDITGLTTALAGKADSIHSHAQADITGLTTALASKVETSDSRLTDARNPLAHTHTIANVTGLQVALDAKSGLSHTHTQGEITGLSQALAGVPQKMKTSSDQSITSTSYVDITGLSFPVLPNTDYAFDFYIVWSSAATTTGVAFALNGPASPVMLHATLEYTGTTATTTVLRNHTTYDVNDTATTGVAAANTPYFCRIKGVLRNGANSGNLVVRCKSEVSGSAITIRRGSWGTSF